MKVGDIIHYHNSWSITYEIVIDVQFPNIQTLTICDSQNFYVGQTRTIHKNDKAIIKVQENELMSILYGKEIL